VARLTKRTVDHVAAGPKTFSIWDDELKGFGLRTLPSGRKTYVVKCLVKGRQKFITIGPHGPITAEQARIRALEILSDAKSGGEPTRERDEARRSPTVKSLGERVLKEHASIRCKPSTQAEYKRSVELFINPIMGARKVVEVERKDIAQLHHSMNQTPYQANRTLGVLSKMFNLAEIWGLRPDGSNPCRHVRKYAERKRERFLSDEEFARLGEVLIEVERDRTETQSAVNAIRLLMLTGCRLGEIMTLEWAHVHLEARELRLPDSKTGAKVVHFGEAAASIFKRIIRIDGNPYVITGARDGAHLTDLQHPWRRIRARAGLDEVRIHDLRHSFASSALALGEGLPMIGKLLGHTQVQTTARYAHLANAPIKAAAARISDRIGDAIAAKPEGDRAL